MSPHRTKYVKSFLYKKNGKFTHEKPHNKTIVLFKIDFGFNYVSMLYCFLSWWQVFVRILFLFVLKLLCRQSATKNHCLLGEKLGLLWAFFGTSYRTLYYVNRCKLLKPPKKFINLQHILGFTLSLILGKII